MSPRQMARLCYKSLAIYALIAAVGNMSQMLWVLRVPFGIGGRAWWEQIVSLATASVPLLQIAIAIWIWKKADVLAAWTFEYDIQDEPGEPDSVHIPVTADVVQTIVFSCLGVWVLISAIPEGLSVLAWFMVGMKWATGAAADQLNNQMIASVISVIARVGLGFWLVFGTAGVVRIVKRFRDVGLEPPDRPSRAPAPDEETSK